MKNIEHIIADLKHYLPHQAPLKDFVHHNTLSCFQHLPFEQAISRASQIFGYKTSLNIYEYRDLYNRKEIRESMLEKVIIERKGIENADEWIFNLLHKKYNEEISSRLGFFRSWLKSTYHIDFAHEINSKLFKLLGGYLDQGIASWHFPFNKEGFLASIRDLEKNSVADFIHTKKAKNLLYNANITTEQLLSILIGNPKLYESYLFEQQFSHPGWSGIVAAIEQHPDSLLDQRPITLEDLIKFELILEIDVVERKFKRDWRPLGNNIEEEIIDVFAETPITEEDDVKSIFQEAYEWTFFDSVIAGIKKMHGKTHLKQNKTFQALFCIDDREGSIRRHIEQFDPICETYGTPGHFGIPIYYKPKSSNFLTKVCPGSIDPKHVIKEIGETDKMKKDVHFSHWSVHPLLSIPYSLLVGFWSAFMMFVNIFKPSSSPMASSSFSHMGKKSKLSDLHEGDFYKEMQVGFNINEMTDIVESVLKGIGLISDFGGIIYLFGHGGSSINNTHYAGYDCGACSGRPGSVNARLFALMANRDEVREQLKIRNINIPSDTQFVGGLHDTTRDEFEFYDEDLLSLSNAHSHLKNKELFNKALAMNAKERSRRFFSVDSHQSAEKIHLIVKNRSISLFEPRPELNHSTNALCLVGRHSLHEGLFLDRRAFSNSYDYSLDPEGKLLSGILNAAVPVCGGINLEYYFSTVDNQKLGAGSKLPHNVSGLIGVTNGVDGDLRTGLPYQMIDLHSPIRLMMVVEHYPEVVLNVIKQNEQTFQWINNEWIIFTVIHPTTYDAYRFKNGKFHEYVPLKKLLDTVDNVDELVESHNRNFPVFLIKK